MIADLRRLWQEAFGDTEETLDKFFATGFSPDRFHCICEAGHPVSALYRFDCEVSGKRLAYLYAMATLKSHRGKGLARQLLGETHQKLKEKGYAGAILVPGEPSLFAFYEKIGYRTVTTVQEFTCAPAETDIALQEVDGIKYTSLRKHMLPPGGVVEESAIVDYLHTYAKFFAGEGFLLSATVEGDTLIAQELLGDIALAPRILFALGAQEGRFRAPGAGRDFAMYLPLSDDCPQPDYFGLALD